MLVAIYLIAVVMSGNFLMLLLIQPAVIWIVVEVLLTHLPYDFRQLIWGNQQSDDHVIQEQRSAAERRAVRLVRNAYYMRLFQLLLVANLTVSLCIAIANVDLFGLPTGTISVYLFLAIAGALFYRLIHDHQRLMGSYFLGAIERNSHYMGQTLSETRLNELRSYYVPQRFPHWRSLRKFFCGMGIIALLHIFLGTMTNFLVFYGSHGPSSSANSFDVELFDDDLMPTAPRKTLRFGRRLWYPASDAPPSVIELYVENPKVSARGYGAQLDTYWGERVGSQYVYRWFDRDSVVVFYEGDRREVIRISRETARWIASVLDRSHANEETHIEVFAAVGIKSKLLEEFQAESLQAQKVHEFLGP